MAEAADERAVAANAQHAPSRPLAASSDAFPLLGADASLADNYANAEEPPERKWRARFPLAAERFLQPFDDPLIALVQRLEGRWVYWLCMALTGMTAIEVILVAPFVCHVLGLDGLAVELTYLALFTAMLSQVPKRFVWRHRPWMVRRALKRRTDTTSSFPSRAVTCAVVYVFAVCWTVTYNTDRLALAWWMPVAYIAAVLLSSLARISLGVHYPSDCVAGMLQGVLICTLATALWKADLLGCPSCHRDACYAASAATSITWGTLSRVNWLLFGVLCLGAALLALLSLMPPVLFWVKCDRVYGALLPCLVFQLAFLCPTANAARASLAPPPAPEWYSLLYAAGLSCVALVAGVKGGARFAMLGFGLLFVGLLASLVIWRLSL